MERGNKIGRRQVDGRYSVKARISILLFLLLTLIFSCKSTAQSDPQSGVKSPASDATPGSETPVSESAETEKIEEAVDPYGIIEEALPDSDVDAEEESEEALGETLIEAEPAAEPEEEVIEELPEAPIQEETQEDSAQVEEESEPLPPPEPTPPPVEPQAIEPQAEQQPPAQTPPVQPPVQNQVPVQPSTPAPQPPPAATSPVAPPPAVTPSPAAPPATPPAQQGQVPERTAPREPPLPPPFLGPAEPERTPPARQEVPEPVIPELPSLPHDETPEEPIVFSRVVRMTVGQMLDVPFRGTGWVYLGELGNRRGLSYDSRRLDTESGIIVGQSFIFRAETAGTYILKFYRQDFIQDYIINDYVQVIVGETDDTVRGRTGAVVDRGRVVAEPRWPSVPGAAGSTGAIVTPPAGAATETVAETQRPDAVQAAEPASPAVSSSAPAAAAPSQPAASPPADSRLPDEYVRQAKQEFDAGHVEQTLVIMEQMRQRYPSGTDEAWWLLGQLYEANSPARDIRKSLECYRTLVNEYPQSSRVDDARRRIAYLERYYLNIR